MAIKNSPPAANKSNDGNIEVKEVVTSGRGISIAVRRALTIATVLVVVIIAVVVSVVAFHYSDSKHRFQRGTQHDDAVNEGEIETTGDVNAIATESVPGPIRRLPGDIVPESYDLHIRPYLYEEDIADNDRYRFTYDGRVDISLRCVVATDEIVLHFLGVTILRVSVRADTPAAEELSVANMWFDYDHSFMHISLAEGLEPGTRYHLTIHFIGLLGDYSYGIYRMSYVDQGGTERWMVASQMEPLGARYAFPCFDEPAYKAVFNITITHRTDMTALSNGHQINNVDHSDGWSTTTFAPTPVMTTYLVAVVIGNLESTESITASGIRLRMWSIPAAIQSTSLAMQVSSSLLTYFEDYFNITYQTQKLDMVAVPELYPFLAMENWGLVIYRQEFLLFDPEAHTIEVKASVVENVGHELSHQWFGNYVTMGWWTELWLNEGFAAYFGHLGSDIYKPELKAIEKLVSTAFQDLLEEDAHPDSYPIIRQVIDEDSIFNMVVYIKGAAVVRMMHNVLGDNVFRKGLQLYLRQHSYDNVGSDDLWNAFTQADRGHGNIDVKQWMDTWTLQINYPVVNLTRLNRTAVRAQQERYLVNWGDETEASQASPFGYNWHIYLTHTNNHSRNYLNPSSMWLTDGNPHEFSLGSTVTTSDWYLANIDAYGVYRVNYDLDNWWRLIAQLASDHEAIPTLSRVQLLGDSFGLAMSGHLPLDIPLNLARYLGDEVSSAPWNVARRYLDTLWDLLETTGVQNPYEMYLLELTGDLYQHLSNLNVTSVDQTRTLATVRSLACLVRHTDCMRHVLAIFNEYVAAYRRSPQSPVISTRFDPESLADVLCLAIRNGGQAPWRKAWSLYRDKHLNMSTTSVDMWLGALSCTQNPQRIHRLIFYPLRNGNLSHTVYVLRSIPSTPVGKKLAWDYLSHYWNSLYEAYGGSYEMDEIISDVTGGFHSNQRLEELESFASSGDLGSGLEFINAAIKTTKKNIAQFSLVYPGLESWLQSYHPQ